ncbi:MAG: glycosyltransferase [Verrucomicrobia bacterium]|nr:glycosyltransferase [Verrucomicrobiota bacterium]
MACLQTCLKSLASTLPSGLAHEIILVDDGSTDGTREFLQGLALPYVVLRQDRPLGYTASVNRAARIARGQYLALLDDSVVLQPGWLEPLLAAFAREPRAGVVGNIQVHADTLQVEHAGIEFQQGGYPVPRRESIQTMQASGAWLTVPAVATTCCLVSRDWFVRSGGFDEGYRHGFAAFDLCLRAREDGLVNLLATASVVRHGSALPGHRESHEYRDARRFLDRWQPRTLALEQERTFAEARAQAATLARRYLAPLHRRLGLGSRALRRQHRAALAAVQRARFNQTRPIRIGVDLLRMAPGGANGGIKPLLFAFLAEMGRQRGAAFNFAVFAPESLRSELAPVLRPGDYLLVPSDTALGVSRRTTAAWRPDGTMNSDANVAAQAGLDVLYTPFTVSRFHQPGLPWVSLAVDLLHRDLPSALPVEEVNFRHDCFSRMAAGASYIQCLTRHGIERLSHHYGVHPARCFHTYIPAQSRLPSAAPSVPPAPIPAGPFFFYPANFWPHKNHEALLAAYRIYATAAGSRAWPLVCTGAPDRRMELIREMTLGLGLGDRVIFPGHLDDAAFAALWSQAGALVFASLHEGFGIPLLEAMSFGVPIIAGDLPVIREVAGEAFLPVDTRNPQALAEAMRRLAIRENLRADLAARGRARLAAFSLSLEAGRLAHFLEAAARRQSP